MVEHCATDRQASDVSSPSLGPPARLKQILHYVNPSKAQKPEAHTSLTYKNPQCLGFCKYKAYGPILLGPF